MFRPKNIGNSANKNHTVHLCQMKQWLAMRQAGFLSPNYNLLPFQTGRAGTFQGILLYLEVVDRMNQAAICYLRT